MRAASPTATSQADALAGNTTDASAGARRERLEAFVVVDAAWAREADTARTRMAAVADSVSFGTKVRD